MERPALTRSSSSSTLSCITVRNDVGDVSSLPTTPPTSTTDASSVSTDKTKRNPDSEDTRRVTRPRRGLESYNEHVLSGTAKKSKNGGGEDSRTVSGETLVDRTVAKRETLLDDGIKALYVDWEIDAMHRGNRVGPGDREIIKRRRSTRLELVGKATDMINEAAITLGKRGREALESGREKIQTLKSDRRSSLRPRLDIAAHKEVEKPPKKKVCLPDLVTVKVEPRQSSPIRITEVVPKDKRWLSQGLYVGQDRDFDPRRTESKNKLKAASKKTGEEKKSSLLPLPMFAGQRMIENERFFKLPFDIFSPLPPGQPKPSERQWKRTQKNVFIGDAASMWKKTKLEEESRCICTPDTGCDEDCQNRFMFYECDETNCNVGDKLCSNRSFSNLRQRYKTKTGDKYNFGVEVVKTTDRGYGVRSSRTFRPDQIIVEYAGEIITQEECDSRMEERYKDNECYYLMSFDQNMIIDATRGSIARFVNHSCEPNCKMVKWTVAGQPRMALFAGSKGIMTGEELTYDYNFDPFSIKNVQECHCGAPACRGVLGPRPKDQPKRKEDQILPKPLLRGVERRLQQVLTGKGRDSQTNGVKKRRIALSKSAAAILAKGKAQISKSLAKSSIAPAKKHLKVVKKTSLASLSSSQKSVRRNTTLSRFTKNIKALPGITYSRKVALSSSSVSSSLSKRQKNLQTGVRSDNIKTTVASVRRNVVRTVKGSRRAAVAAKKSSLEGFDEDGKTIRVIAVGGVED
ncbi:MAG: hypothetical protein M1827_007340 [Pycnora praestabilis]|nr:MAG: hypothetical protein M1827_007340 [Pycnora praestabilis]